MKRRPVALLLILTCMSLSLSAFSGAAAVSPATQGGASLGSGFQNVLPSDVVAALIETPFPIEGLPAGLGAPVVDAWSDPADSDLIGTVGAVTVSLGGPDAPLGLPGVSFRVYPDAFVAAYYFDQERGTAEAELKLDSHPFDYVYYVTAQDALVVAVVLIDNVVVVGAVEVARNSSETVIRETLDQLVAITAVAVAHVEAVAGVTQKGFAFDSLGLIDRSSSRRSGRLLDQVNSTTDVLGRVPLSRPTFAPGAELPAGILTGPLVAVVDAGSFDITIDGVTTTADAGDSFSLEASQVLSAANRGPEWGAWLVLMLPGSCREYADYACQPESFPDMIICSDCLPDGVTNWQVFREINFLRRLGHAAFSIDRIVIPADAELVSLDLGGDTPASEIFVYVEAGAIEVNPVGRVLEAGQTARYSAGQATGARPSGALGASLLVVRLADPSP